MSCRIGSTVTDLPKYFSLGSDADSVIVNGRIDASSSPGDEGYTSPPYFFLVRPHQTKVANASYQFLRNTESVGLRQIFRGLVIQTVPSSQANKNDLSLTTDSAKFTGFTPLVSGTNDYFPYNHTSVGNPSIGALVLKGIRAAQPMVQ